VLAYAKITLYAALLESDLPEDAALDDELDLYFPAPLPERFGDVMRRHRLRREIVATRVTNDLIDRAGTTFVFRLGEDTGASPADIARASIVAREVFGVRSVWEEIEALDGSVAADIQGEMLLSSRRSVERATRWLLRSRPRPLDIAAEIARYAEGARTVAGGLPGFLVESEQEAWRERVGRLTEAGVPEGVAARVATQSALFSTFDIVEVAGATEREIEEVAALHFQLGGALALHWLRDQIGALPRVNRWQAMARAALRDDLFALHAGLTADVLRHGGIDAWMEANRHAADRAQEILGEIRSGGTFDLTTLPVAMREVRNLIQLRSPAPAA